MKRKYFIGLIGIGFAIFSANCEGPQGPPGPPGSGIDDLINPAIPPRVIYTYPLPNSTGPYEELDFYYPRITMRFNKIMTRSSLRQAITISSPRTSVRVDTNTIYTLGGDIFTFAPRDSVNSPYYFRWRIGETYTLAVSSSAQDVNGNYLVPSFLMTIVPEPRFRVVFISPSNGSTGIPSYRYIYLDFNSPVDTSIFSNIQIIPSIPEGRWRYYYGDSTGILFDHEGMNNNTTYTVTIPANATDKFGNQLTQPYISSFTTDVFRVRDSYPSNGSTNISLNSYIRATFSALLDTGTVRQAVSISPPVAGTFSLSDGSPTFHFYPTDGLAGNTLYAVTISTALSSKNGTNLATPYTFSFTTAPFQIIDTNPDDGQTNVSRSTSIAVYFNGIRDTATIRSAFSVIPGIAGNFYYYETSYFYFYPSSTLAANQMYSVTIANSIRSKSGTNLTSPYSFSFTTGN